MESVPKRETTADQGMTTASVLAIIGGALMVAGVIGGGMMFGIWNGGGMMSGGMMGGDGMMSDSFMWGTIAGVGALWAGTGVVTIIGGYAIYRKPESAGTWGVAILVASIVGLLSMSGFFVGPILGIVAGILALARK